MSELDGWWAEAYTPKLGWALGDGREHGDDPAWDAAEAEALYDLLEREVVPEFYSRGEDRLPGAWIARMRESMALLTPRFSTNRTVREYTEQHYMPAAATYLERAANGGVIGVDIVNGARALDQAWASLCFGETRCMTRGGQHEFEVEVRLGHLQPKAVRIELYANGTMDDPATRQEMRCLYQLNDASGGRVYGATVPAIRTPEDYTARVIPNARGSSIPLENARILWQR